MLVDPYIQDIQNTNAPAIKISREQASVFAKEVADDFNPLHDISAKRFCVPGDLLFALVLSKYGVSQQMQFHFSGMVTDEVTLLLPDDAKQFSIMGTNDKEYLRVSQGGDNSRREVLINQLTQSYVTFSGHTFPHVLIPLMQAQQVMINPARPMVMYESMLIDLQRLDVEDIELSLDEEKTRLEVNGKRGKVCLAFNLSANNEYIGRGEKHMLVSGLMPFDQSAVDQVIAEYNQWKSEYPASTST